MITVGRSFLRDGPRPLPFASATVIWEALLLGLARSRTLVGELDEKVDTTGTLAALCVFSPSETPALICVSEGSRPLGRNGKLRI
jgi:hypothetical protein